MNKLRITINSVSLAIICGGALLLVPTAQADPISGGTCCNQREATCYLNLDGILVKQTGARSC